RFPSILQIRRSRLPGSYFAALRDETAAHGPRLVRTLTPRSDRRKSDDASRMLYAHSHMATYWFRYHLLTPRNGRRKLPTPVHNPSMVLLWTSRIPSPSSSRAHSRFPGVWHTEARLRPRCGRRS